MRQIEIYFDGGSAGLKGYGSYEIVGKGEPPLNHKALRQKFEGSVSCNMAEYLALIAALKYLRHHCEPESVNLWIFTDSQLLARQMTGRYRTKTPHIKELATEVRSLIAGYNHCGFTWRPRAHNVRRFGH